MASKNPSSTLYWPIVTCLLLPGGMRPVLLLLLVATPISVRPTATTPGTLFIWSTMLSVFESSW